MPTEWYIHRDDEKYGPFSTRDLRSFAAEGRLQPDDKVWKDGLEKPIRARQIKSLFTSHSNGDSSESPAVDSTHDDDGDSFDVLPELPQSRSSDKRAKAKEALGQGVDMARKALKTGTERLRATFGAATLETRTVAYSSMGELLSRPIQYAFGTLVLLIACALSIPGLVTIMLIPVFVLGYVSYVQSVLKREPASLGRFIIFMRHGWDSLWHLFMLLGTFFIAAAIAIAPLVIAGIILYATVGTLSLGGLQLMSFMPAGSSTSREGSDLHHDGRERGPQRMQDFGNQRKDGFTTHVIGAVNAIMENVVKVASLSLLGMIAAVLLTPSGSILVLVYCITLMVATGKGEVVGKYELVYEAFQRMLLIAYRDWKRLVVSGLWLVAMPIIGSIVAFLVYMVFAWLAADFGLWFFAAWFVLILFPIFIFGFPIYVNIFSVKTAMQLVESHEAA